MSGMHAVAPGSRPGPARCSPRSTWSRPPSTSRSATTRRARRRSSGSRPACLADKPLLVLDEPMERSRSEGAGAREALPPRLARRRRDGVPEHPPARGTRAACCDRMGVLHDGAIALRRLPGPACAKRFPAAHARGILDRLRLVTRPGMFLRRRQGLFHAADRAGPGGSMRLGNSLWIPAPRLREDKLRGNDAIDTDGVVAPPSFPRRAHR